MFYFTLVHVPGSHHTPNGLSRRQPQPGDEEELEDNFEDWINNVNSDRNEIVLHGYTKFHFFFYLSNKNPVLITAGAVRVKSADYTG